MRIAALGALLLALSGCGIFERSDEQPASLDTTAIRIKTQLINQQALDAAAIQVDECNGVIYLHGFADNEAKKRRIEALAREVAGDRQIVNQIEIR